MEGLSNILKFVIFETHGFRFCVYNLVNASLVLLIAWGVTRVISRMLDREVARKLHKDERRRKALLQIVKYFVYVTAFILALQSLGANISWMLGGSAALMVGIGLGLQSTFNDFISGVILLFEGSLNEGDVVEVGGLIGRVQKISLRTTLIYTRENIGVVVPNSKFTNDNVINWSHTTNPTRFKVTVGVAYGSDITVVETALQEAVKDNPAVLKTPPVEIRLADFGDSSLVYEIYFWAIKVFEIEAIKGKIRRAVNLSLKKHGITIPFPQRDLHLISDTRGNTPSANPTSPE